MKTFVYVLLILTIGFSKVFAQDASSTVKLSAKYLDSKMGANWKGIIYVCDPFCRFISIKEATRWSPDISEETVELSTIKGISQTDPEYPLLIVRLPVAPYVNKSAEKSKDQSLVVNPDKRPPAFAKMPFKYGWNLLTGLTYNNMAINSDSSIQNSSSPQSSFSQLDFNIGFMKGQPTLIFGRWFQHSLFIDLNKAGSFQTADGASGSLEKLEYNYQVLNALANKKVGLHIGQLSQSLKYGSEAINHYSNDASIYYLGLVYQTKNRWVFHFDYALTNSIHDSQSFRQNPINDQWYRALAQYCSRTYIVFDFRVGYCGVLSYQVDKQVAGLVSDVSVTSQSTIESRLTSIKLLIRFGEDFFK